MGKLGCGNAYRKENGDRCVGCVFFLDRELLKSCPGTGNSSEPATPKKKDEAGLHGARQIFGATGQVTRRRAEREKKKGTWEHGNMGTGNLLVGTSRWARGGKKMAMENTKRPGQQTKVKGNQSTKGREGEVDDGLKIRATPGRNKTAALCSRGWWQNRNRAHRPI